MSLRKRTLNGLLWTFSERFGIQAVNFVASVFLARLLLPEQFGLIGMLTFFVAIGNSLIDSGLTSSLIRSTDLKDIDYSTVFFLNLAGSVFMYFILFISAPLIAVFYQQPELEGIARIYCLVFIINAFSTVQSTRLTKVMNFRPQILASTSSVIISGIFGVALAFHGYGVWSLVLMSIAQSIISSIMLWTLSGWRPSFDFDLNILKKHFSFGYKLTLSSLINTVYQNLYTLIIGKFFSASQLGYFTRANTLRQLPIRNISAALNRVTYPMFAEIQNDDIKLKAVYRKLMQQVLFWICPILVWMGIFAEPLFVLLFSDKWLPAVPYFQIMCVSGVFYPLAAYNLNILKVKGKSGLILKLEIIRKSFTVVAIFLVIPFGITGLLYFQVATTIIGFVINTYYSGKLINYSLTEQIKDFYPILLISGIVGIIINTAGFLVEQRVALPDVFLLVITCIVGAGFYVLLSKIFNIKPLNDFKSIILNKV